MGLMVSWGNSTAYNEPTWTASPKAGLYYLDLTGGNTATTCSMIRPSDQPWTLVLADSANPSHCGDVPQPLYFYVPKGTKKIQFCGWDGYGNHTFKIRNPDGEPLEEVPTGKSLRSVAVNPGDDGLTWSITGLCLGKLYFFNIPNYVAPSPNALLVPREVAIADKLPVVK
jgi:hypothetical protein